MEKYKSQAAIFKVLMHPARLAILDLLREGEQCVCHMEAVLGYRQAYTSQHLGVLREAGLVQDRRDGWNVFYQVIRPEIYIVLDSARAVSGQANEQRQPQNGKGKKTSACPCPKCNRAG